MDSERFDRLARSLGQTRSRRQTLRGLAGAVAVGAVAVGGRGASAGVCKSAGKPCKKRDQCCADLNCVGATGGSTGQSVGTCQQVASTCPAGGDVCFSTTPCGSTGNCVCSTGLGGSNVCWDVRAPRRCATCEDDSGCGEGYACALASCCDQAGLARNACVLRC